MNRGILRNRTGKHDSYNPFQYKKIKVNRERDEKEEDKNRQKFLSNFRFRYISYSVKENYNCHKLHT